MHGGTIFFHKSFGDLWKEKDNRAKNKLCHCERGTSEAIANCAGDDVRTDYKVRDCRAALAMT